MLLKQRLHSYNDDSVTLGQMTSLHSKRISKFEKLNQRYETMHSTVAPM